MNDDHTDKATDKNVGDPTKSSGELEEILDGFIDDASTEKRLDGNMAWTPLLMLDDFDRDGLVEAIRSWHTTRTTKLQAEARIDEMHIAAEAHRNADAKGLPKGFQKRMNELQKQLAQLEREHKIGGDGE